MIISRATEWEMEDKEIDRMQKFFNLTVYPIWFMLVCLMFWASWYFGAVH
jgi:hypothetical protein